MTREFREGTIGDLERLGPGICDGCGDHKPMLIAFDAPQLACGICLCEDCVAEDPDA